MMKYRCHRATAFCKVVFCKSKGEKILMLQAIHYLGLLNVSRENTWKTSPAAELKRAEADFLSPKWIVYTLSSQIH